MQRLNVLSIQSLSAEDRAKIEAVNPAIQLVDAGGWFDGEIRETWPFFTSARYLKPSATGVGTREERDHLLAEAEVILGGWPYPLDLRARASRLKWFYQRLSLARARRPTTPSWRTLKIRSAASRTAWR